MPGFDNMGVVNAKYGVCGVTSSLYALHNKSPDVLQAKLERFAKNETWMMNQIKNYLVSLKESGKQDLISAINTFTKSFEGFDHFSVDNYIWKIDNIADVGMQDFSIAMPPNVVIDYLRRVCKFAGAKEVPLATSGTEFILGVRDADGKDTPLKGLIHYLYYLNGVVYSWGEKFGGGTEAKAVAAAGESQETNYEVVYKISPRG